MGLISRKTPTDKEMISSWGMPYTLKRSKRRSLGVEIKDGKVIVRAPLVCSEVNINRFIESHKRWLISHLAKVEVRKDQAMAAGALTEEDIKALSLKAKKVIPDRVRYYAEKVGVTYGRISIRSQSTRWGSCSSKGNLNFNCLLMLTPVEVMDSVIVHELCHRKEMNHSDRFYREVLKVYPDYYKWHKWLTDNGGVLIQRMKLQ